MVNRTHPAGRLIHSMTKRFWALLTELNILPASIQQTRLKDELVDWKGEQAHNR